MVNFKSSLGSTNIQGEEPRHFTVGDESDGTSVHNSPVQKMSFSSTESVMPAEYQPQISKNPASQNQVFLSSNEVSAEEVMAFRQKIISERTGQIHQSHIQDKRKLDIILGIGRQFVEVPIFVDNEKIVFRLQTLKSKEKQHVFNALDDLYKLKTNDALQEVRNVYLTYCIYSIDGLTLDSILKLQDLSEKERYYVRYEFVRELDDNLALFLFKKFEKLDQDSKSRFALDTTEGVKEVAEAIKKS